MRRFLTLLPFIASLLTFVVCVLPAHSQPNYFGDNPSAQEIRAKIVAAGQRYQIPPHILFGIAMQESGWKQFRSDRRTVYHLEPDGRVGVGIMQITVFPSVSNYQRLCEDIDYNIDQGAAILSGKWNATPIIGDNAREKLENWYYAVWAYNGFASVNNPNVSSSPYQKKVYNWIASCPNGQWENCTVSEPTNAQIGNPPKTIPNTPTPIHVDANYDGIIDGTSGGGGSGGSASDIYVNASYSGPEDGSQNKPYRSFDQAVSVAIASSASSVTIHVKGGNYTLNQAIRGKSIKIVNDGGGSVTIRK